MAMLRSEMHVRAGAPLLSQALQNARVIAFLAITVGALGIVWNAFSPTEFSFSGLKLSTGSVGVAIVGLGVVALILVNRRTMKALETLAALPPDEIRRVTIHRTESPADPDEIRALIAES